MGSNKYIQQHKIVSFLSSLSSFKIQYSMYSLLAPNHCTIESLIAPKQYSMNFLTITNQFPAYCLTVPKQYLVNSLYYSGMGEFPSSLCKFKWLFISSIISVGKCPCMTSSVLVDSILMSS